MFCINRFDIRIKNHNRLLSTTNIKTVKLGYIPTSQFITNHYREYLGYLNYKNIEKDRYEFNKLYSSYSLIRSHSIQIIDKMKNIDRNKRILKLEQYENVKNKGNYHLNFIRPFIEFTFHLSKYKNILPLFIVNCNDKQYLFNSDIFKNEKNVNIVSKIIHHNDITPKNREEWLKINSTDIPLSSIEFILQVSKIYIEKDSWCDKLLYELYLNFYIQSDLKIQSINSFKNYIDVKLNYLNKPNQTIQSIKYNDFSFIYPVHKSNMLKETQDYMNNNNLFIDNSSVYKVYNDIKNHGDFEKLGHTINTFTWTINQLNMINEIGWEGWVTKIIETFF